MANKASLTWTIFFWNAFSFGSVSGAVAVLIRLRESNKFWSRLSTAKLFDATAITPKSVGLFNRIHEN